MSVRSPARPAVAPAKLTDLSTLMMEPESTVADPPLAVPHSAGVLLLLLLLSPGTPKEPRR
ncbi:hypothetical protein [Kibdelosporangium phytohabitans]|uniref:Uncharacterized protein n=1 Tax=Kibdelosporangium phytohabitans TaxID=860235 RepID=A0A0N9I1V1_9PSEU|nr:hypothetical protein [Kibdelosporangium phytohabitans]ALG09832.1 hypothetical protein AOZ06_25650 [Kibdelosporangium phytohabitans]MBE1468780.1 hypothetical protein [Kibdelosporangium phytohabitans]